MICNKHGNVDELCMEFLGVGICSAASNALRSWDAVVLVNLKIFKCQCKFNN